VDKSNTVNGIGVFDIPFGSMFSAQAKLIGWIIEIITIIITPAIIFFIQDYP
jgi:hypothetical protein